MDMIDVFLSTISNFKLMQQAKLEQEQQTCNFETTVLRQRVTLLRSNSITRMIILSILLICFIATICNAEFLSSGEDVSIFVADHLAQHDVSKHFTSSHNY